MTRLIALAAGVGIISAAAASGPPARESAPRTETVQVHCPAGDNPAFVTPVRVEIALGDSVEWNTPGQAAFDSIEITPKDPGQAWPFEGSPSRGQSSARASRATITGTYRYNVRVLCRVPTLRWETIDPDIIIGG